MKLVRLNESYLPFEDDFEYSSTHIKLVSKYISRYNHHFGERKATFEVSILLNNTDKSIEYSKTIPVDDYSDFKEDHEYYKEYIYKFIKETPSNKLSSIFAHDLCIELEKEDFILDYHPDKI